MMDNLKAEQQESVAARMVSLEETSKARLDNSTNPQKALISIVFSYILVFFVHTFHDFFNFLMFKNL